MEWITLIFALIEQCQDKSDEQLVAAIQSPGRFAISQAARRLAREDGTRLRRKNREKYLRRAEKEASRITDKEAHDIVQMFRNRSN